MSRHRGGTRRSARHWIAGVMLAVAFFTNQAQARRNPMGEDILVKEASINDVAASMIEGGQPVIYVNSAVMATLSSTMRDFFMDHEVGHHRLGHLILQQSDGGLAHVLFSEAQEA